MKWLGMKSSPEEVESMLEEYDEEWEMRTKWVFSIVDLGQVMGLG